jgi:hypothetical protein
MRDTSGILDKRIPELDGLRGLAALLVLIAHYFGYVAHGTKALAFDWLGVDLFFVLSGFLIGSIILANHTQPNFFLSFYLRRAARIVPVYGLSAARRWRWRQCSAVTPGRIIPLAPVFTPPSCRIWWSVCAAAAASG